MISPLSRSASARLPASAGMNTPTQETAHGHVRPYFTQKLDAEPHDSALQIRWHVSEPVAATASQRDEVVLDGNRPPGPHNPRSIGHARRLTDPGYGTLQTRLSRLTEIDEDGVVEAPSQVNEDRNRPRRMNSLLSENSYRPGASSEHGSEMPVSIYYTERSMPGGEVWSEGRAGSSEMGTEISLPVPSYHTKPVTTSARPGRRSYLST